MPSEEQLTFGNLRSTIGGCAVSGTGWTTHNARVQLLATAFSNLSLAVIVTGVLAPAVNGQLHGTGRVVAVLAWVGLGVVLHAVAQAVLGRLRG